jgi:spermidine synthase
MKGVKKYLPHLVVFISSMGIMIIELVASRIIAKYFGDSLYTWTAIIGVVLGGITFGNYLGGRLADRFDVRRAARTLLLTGAALVLLILALDVGVEAAMSTMAMPQGQWPLIAAAVLVITLMFFLPAMALGTISPIMATYALEENEQVGSTVGSIYASGSAGSIIGTFLSGFVLVPLLGIRTVVITVAAVIALLSLLIRGRRRSLAAVLGGIILLLGAVEIAPRTGLLPWFGGQDEVVFETDSMYSHITVEDREDGERVLVMDGLIHNRHDPDKPERLLYSYERIYRAATDAYAAAGAKAGGGGLRTLTLGGGALTFPSYLERHYPQSRNTVVEIDPQVIETAHRFFDVPRDTDLRIRIADARQYVRTNGGEQRFDIIYLDVFDSYSIPSHLATREFTAELRRALEPDGLLLVNLIDIYDEGRFLAAYSRTAEQVFEEVKVYAAADFSRSARSTFVLAAGPGAKALGMLAGAGGEQYELIESGELSRLQQRNGSPVLTDNYAPVEILMAPVFLRALL